MAEEHPFDLYAFSHQLAIAAPWLDEIYVFGSRRHLSNESYGSDIDILLVPNTTIATAVVRELVEDPYIDAFVLHDSVAFSTGNDTRIPVNRKDISKSLDAVKIWTRIEGWKTGDDYRILSILPNKVPAMTVAAAGAHPVILFCALPSEFQAVVNRLPKGKSKTHRHLPPQYVTHITSASGRKRLVVVVATGVASVNASVSATRILDYYDHPEFAVLVGITAGLKGGDTTLGDILVPLATVDVESGKLTPKGKQPAGFTYGMSVNHQRAVATWPKFQSWAKEWAIKTGLGTPRIHGACALACTSSVIAYDKPAQEFRDWNRKIAGIEMEAVGIAAATENRCPLIVIKSISDWADEHKNDEWHQYCIEISADLTVSLLEEEVI